MIPDSQLAHWEQLCREATPGEWRVDVNISAVREGPKDRWGKMVCALYHGYSNFGGNDLPTAQRLPNLAFIAEARTALPALLAEVRRAHQAILNHRELLADMVNQFAYRVKEHEPQAREYWWFHDGGLSTLEGAIPALVSCGWMRKVDRADKDWYEFVPEAER